MKKDLKVSQETASDIINHIVQTRATYKDHAIDEAIRLFRYNSCYGVVHDYVMNSTRYTIGQLMGMYALATYLGVISEDDCIKLDGDLLSNFDVDMIIESAINKMKGSEKHGK